MGYVTRKIAFESTFLKKILFLRNVLKPFLRHPSIPSIFKYFSFIFDWMKYKRMVVDRKERTLIRDWYPCLFDKTPTTAIDPHYFYLGVWAAKKIYFTKPACHVDVGSQLQFVGFLTTFTDVIFVDIRQAEVSLDRFKCRPGSILNLPFENNSLYSISCLHVAEHIGLGRYGDPIDPHGTEKACKELSRVLSPDGNLFFALPIGVPRVCFNAHRIHSTKMIIEYFSGLDLVEYSGVHDDGRYVENVDIDEFADSQYACGLFWFRKPRDGGVKINYG